MNWMAQMAKCIKNRKEGEKLDEILKRCAALRKKTVKNIGNKRNRGTQKLRKTKD